MSEANDLNTLLCVLNKEIRFVFDNDESFLAALVKAKNVMDLTEVSFTSHHLKIVYVLDDGQHVAGRVGMDDYLSWRTHNAAVVRPA